MRTSTISIGLTVHTEDKAVGMAADDTTSVEEATIAMAIMAVATVAIATMAWATVAMATMVAIIITVAQTREAYGKATVEEVEEDTKAFNRRNVTSATNQDAGPTSIP
jgi:fatty acid desaturase